MAAIRADASLTSLLAPWLRAREIHVHAVDLDGVLRGGARLVTLVQSDPGATEIDGADTDGFGALREVDGESAVGGVGTGEGWGEQECQA